VTAGRLAGKVVIVTGGATGIGRAVAGRVIAKAGGVAAAGLLPGVADEAWQTELRQNLTSVFYSMKHQSPAMTGSGGESIVNNASTGGVRGIPGLGAYVAAKHGVVGLTRSAALAGASTGVRVNALVTGNVDTPLYRDLLGVPAGGELPGCAPNPTGRVSSAAEIAAFVALLLSEESAFITGAALAIDGGATAQ
jgi:NAD(P)-dependent dehydrogenase (short-subunit alcohol dehydrogenase family)